MRPILRRSRCARIGGNVAENSGGAHCLKYGFTTTHVLGLEVVLPDGSLVHFGGATLDHPGYDLCGVFVGSEGTLGIATKVVLRIVKRPECVLTLLAAFDSTERGRRGGQRHHRCGHLAGGDRNDGQSRHPGCRSRRSRQLSRLRWAAAGGTRWPAAEVEALMLRVKGICTALRRVGNSPGAVRRRARRHLERSQGCLCRRGTHLAQLHRAGRRHSAYLAATGHERDRAPQRGVAGLRVANVFHAGDGNLHPLVLYDRKIEGQEHNAEKLACAILEFCVKVGGSITGEHGVGEEKKRVHVRDVRRARSRNHAARSMRLRPEQLSNPTQDLSAHPALRGEARPVRAASPGNRRQGAVFLIPDHGPALRSSEQAGRPDGLGRNCHHRRRRSSPPRDAGGRRGRGISCARCRARII